LCLRLRYVWALVVFGQAVDATELVAAIRTPKGHKRLLPTLLTIHTLISHTFLCIEKTLRFICFPQKALKLLTDLLGKPLKHPEAKTIDTQLNEESREK